MTGVQQSSGHSPEPGHDGAAISFGQRGCHDFRHHPARHERLNRGRVKSYRDQPCVSAHGSIAAQRGGAGRNLSTLQSPTRDHAFFVGFRDVARFDQPPPRIVGIDKEEIGLRWQLIRRRTDCRDNQVAVMVRGWRHNIGALGRSHGHGHVRPHGVAIDLFSFGVQS